MPTGPPRDDNSPAAVSIADKDEQLGDGETPGGGDLEKSQTVLLTPPSRGQRRRLRRRTGGSRVSSPSVSQRHVYVASDEVKHVLQSWGMTLDAGGLAQFRSRFAPEHNETLFDYTDFTLIIADILRPGALCVPRLRDGCRACDHWLVTVLHQGCVRRLAGQPSSV
jgi:hypothetical protein